MTVNVIKSRIGDVSYTIEDIINIIYPVGTIYKSVNNVNPSTFFSGTTWESWGVGRSPIGVDPSNPDLNSADLQVGSLTETHTHTLSDDGYAKTAVIGGQGASVWGSAPDGVPITAPESYEANMGGITNSSVQSTNWVTPLGGNTDSSEISVLHPVQTCYFWKRIA